MKAGIGVLPLRKDFLRLMQRAVPRFIAKLLAAPDAAVSRALLGVSYGVRVVDTSQVLTAADVGQQIAFFDAGGSATFTLPASSSVPHGAQVSVTHRSNTGTVTILPAGADGIFAGEDDVFSLVLREGDTAVLVNAPGGWNLSHGTAALFYSTGAPLLGTIRQSYQDVTAFRSANTTSTNVTARPIFVVITVNAGANLAVSAQVGAQTLANTAVQTNLPLVFFFVVRPGETYRLNTSATILRWMELR